MNINYQSLRSRYVLLAACAALLALLLIMTAIGLSRVETLNRQIGDAIRNQQNQASLVSAALRAARERSKLMNVLVETDSAPLRDQAYASYLALTRVVKENTGRLRSLDAAAEQPDMKKAYAAADRSAGAGDDIAASLIAEKTATARIRLIIKSSEAQDEVEEALYLLQETGRVVSQNNIGVAGAAARNVILLIVGVWVLVLLAAGFLSAMIMRQVGRTENELQFEKELAQVTLHSIGDGVITTDADGRVEYLNPVAERYTGWLTQDAHGKPLEEVYRVIDERTGRAVEPFAADAAGSREERDSGSVRLVDRSGRECPIRYSLESIRSREGRALGMIVVFHDISQIRAMSQQLIWQASHDALTGLVNRREFERRLAGLMETAKSGNREHALMFMDLDNFKAVNDTCGHGAGDELLRQLTAVMMSRMRGSDTLARLGGDEFGALLETCPLDQALRIANAMRETVREFRFVWENKTFSVGVSIGLVPLTADSGDLSHVLSMADACCYDAKSKGRDRVQVHRQGESDFSVKHSELQVVAQINNAFERGQFRLYRQLIQPLSPEAKPGLHYEVLVRMLDQSGNLLPPTAFMPEAERYNLLTSIERWVISSLIEFLHRRFSAAAVRLPLGAGLGSYSVNISGASINDKSFPDFLRNLLTRYQLPRGLLCFEITETTAISNLTKASELMREMKELGCRFSLDDFGTGMSSFAYLKYLPVDYLKIAGMFVKDIAVDPMDFAIVEAINRISHILGMQTVAESVEDAEVLEKLTSLKVDFAQGYFIAEPEELLADEHTEPVAIRSA